MKINGISRVVNNDLVEVLTSAFGYSGNECEIEDAFITAEAKKITDTIEGSEKQMVWVTDIIESALRNAVIQASSTEVFYYIKMVNKMAVEHPNASWWIDVFRVGSYSVQMVSMDEDFKNIKREMRQSGFNLVQKAQYIMENV